MGFDASVISGVVGFIETEFELSKLELGWTVSSLALTATFAMMVAGPVSDRIGRRAVLSAAAILFAVSAVLSAFAPTFALLVLARMIGGLGVGAALIIAPMYIAEIAPAESRGRLVSFNQLNIVVGISAAFFSNYLILMLGESEFAWAAQLRLGEFNWRWMLGIEALPAVVYFLALLSVPESPRWLAMRNHDTEAVAVLEKLRSPGRAPAEFREIRRSLKEESGLAKASLTELFNPSMKLVLTIGVSVGILQQITGINSVLFYAPMIFERTGIGTDTAFMQAVMVGLVNLLFTLVAIALIDRLGRRPLLAFGLTGIAVGMLTLAYGFSTATYTLDRSAIEALPEEIDRPRVMVLVDQVFTSDVDFRESVASKIGAENYSKHESALIRNAIDVNSFLVLAGILGFIASFAVSIGPVMWVLFSELFPNRVRGMAISFVGLINSTVAFLVSLVFPWELENLGNTKTFLVYGVIAVVGLVFVLRILPETRGRSLEELERELVRA
jgi:MFS family permease